MQGTLILKLLVHMQVFSEEHSLTRMVCGRLLLRGQL